MKPCETSKQTMLTMHGGNLGIPDLEGSEEEFRAEFPI
jgi:hypothetical protein